jgi:hypothetical protein
MKFSIAIKKIVQPLKNLSDRKKMVKNRFFFITCPALNKPSVLSRAINNNQPKTIGRIIHLFLIFTPTSFDCTQCELLKIKPDTE